MDQAMLETAVLAQPSTTQDITTLTTLLPRVSVVVPALNEAANLPLRAPAHPGRARGHPRRRRVHRRHDRGRARMPPGRAHRHAGAPRQGRRARGRLRAPRPATSSSRSTPTAPSAPRRSSASSPRSAPAPTSSRARASSRAAAAPTSPGCAAPGNALPRRRREHALRRALHRHLLRLQRLLARDTDRISGGGDGFEGELLMPIRAVQADLDVAEVPCQEDERIHGESTPASLPRRHAHPEDVRRRVPAPRPADQRRAAGRRARAPRALAPARRRQRLRLSPAAPG